MRRWFSLAVFLAISLGGGLLVGSRNTPDDGYRGLAKPWFNPPDRVSYAALLNGAIWRPNG